MRKILLHSSQLSLARFGLLCVAWVMACIGENFAFYMEGTKNSFAQFPRWLPGPNGSLELSFLTKEPEGLILYTDDGGSFEFFELKLVDGTVRLRYNLGGGARLLSVGKNFNNGEWHKIRVQRRHERTELIVDSYMEGSSVKNINNEFGSALTNSFVWVGGLPSMVSRQVSARLTLQVVTLEPTFIGQIKDLVFSGPSAIPRIQAMIASQGVRHGIPQHSSSCEKLNPCRNGGRCIPTENGPQCDCSNIGYQGVYCETDDEGPSATFRGREYLGWDLRRLGGDPLVALRDSLSLTFKTRQPTGLLFFTGDGKEYVNVALKGGGIVVTVDMGGDALEINMRPDKVRFDDSQEHTIVLNRKVKEITDHTSFCSLSVSVDGIYSEKRTTAGPFSQLSSSRLLLGGADHPALLPGAKTRGNFVGCLSKVEYKADSIRLPFLEMARKGHSLLQTNGKIDFMCQEIDAADPVSFSTTESYLDGPDTRVVNFLSEASFLVLPTWNNPKQGAITFKMRTTEADGVIMYNAGAISAQDDFFAFELMDGHLNLHLNLGSESTKVKVSIRRLDDGVWHEVKLNRDGRAGIVTVDDVSHDFTISGNSHQLDLGGPLYVGGIEENLKVPPGMWMGNLRKGYVGCMRDLVVDRRAMDLASYAKKQDSGSIQEYCHNDGGTCQPNPCMHGGGCRQGWGRFICDCTDSHFIGPICAKDAVTLSFNGSQHLQITSSEPISSQAEDIQFRFKTPRPLGLLITTWNKHSSEKLAVSLQSGSIKLALLTGTKEKIVYSGHGLNDDKWHSVTVKRRANFLSLQVDKEKPVQDVASNQASTLEYHYIYVGLVPNNFTTWVRKTSRDKDSNLMQPFIGLLQSVYLNGQYIFELTRAGHLPNVVVTAEFGKTQQVVHHPVTFKSSAAFVALPQLRAYSSTSIYFQFKTLQPSGLLMFNGGKGRDFFAIELVISHIHLVLNMGDGIIRLRDNSRKPLNDNRWHTVTISRRSSRSFTLMVDDSLATIDVNGKSIYLDLQGYLYLGGVAPDMYSKLPRLVARTGFQGCLASLDLNGEVPDPAGKDVPITSNHVIQGCDGPSTKCREDACSNGGTCNQQWNSYSCNCDMTSFTGPTCSDESTAYEFGPGTGVVTFEYPEGKWPNVHGDLIALGFMTTQKDDATVFRVDSANSNDFMELEIVDGSMFIVYNLGTEDHPIGEEITKVNDGIYHVLKFTRSGPNATLQLDNYDVRSRNPKDITIENISNYKKIKSWIWHGHQLSIFNGRSRLQIGGRRNKRATSLERPFQGIVAGLVLNGERPLDLAAERDTRVSVEGDVHLLMSLPKHMPIRTLPSNHLPNPWQRTPGIPGPTPGEGDDLVYSGAGAGCDVDDEDQCVPDFDTGSGDDLITPVYIPSTRSPLHKSSGDRLQRPDNTNWNGGRPCDDEEDCYVGSGSGEFNTDDIGIHRLDKGDSMEFPMSRKPGSPDVIHSEENGLSFDRSGQMRGHNRYSTTSSRGAWNISQEQPKPTFTSSTSTTSTTTTTTRRPIPAYYFTTTSTTTTDMYDFKRIQYEDYYESNIPESNDGNPDDSPEINQSIHSDSAKQTALVIIIVAGILIVVIIVILIYLYCKGRPNRSHKVDETKSYRSLNQGPTVLINGQGNGVAKNNDRRPVKKQNKDIKEWYV